MSPSLLLRYSSPAVGLHRQNPATNIREWSKFEIPLQFPSSFPLSRPVVVESSSPISPRPASTVSFSFMPGPSSNLPPLTSSVGSPTPGPPTTLVQWHIDDRRILVFNAVACIVSISASWLFLSAIPTLLAFKKAAESLEKLLDVTREELPDTMAAVRLSGMEISDLTMELSDLGQEITQGVRSSTRAVRLAEDRLHRLTMTPTGASH